MDGEGSIEIKFRLADGSDIGPSKYSPALTVASLKEKVVAHWPREKENGPKTLNDVKLIHAGKILENNKTLAESRLQVGELPGGVITMHVVVRPPNPDKKNDIRPKRMKKSSSYSSLKGLGNIVILNYSEKLQNESMGKPGCSCSIL